MLSHWKLCGSGRVVPTAGPCAAIQQLGGKQLGGRLGSLARAWGAKGSVG